MKISKYRSSDYEDFRKMMTTCFHDDYKINLTDEQMEKWLETLIKHAFDGVVFLDILHINDSAKGFILYQIDSNKSDWCEREGWGFIRELYVDASLRGGGYGKMLAQHAEENLKTKGIASIYLTSDEIGDFWIKLGYDDTNEASPTNNCPIFVKNII